MHLAEGTLPLAHAAVWTAAAAPVVVWSARGEAQAPSAPPARALASALMSLLFAVTLFPLPVPGLGATSHICLSPLLGVLLGVRRTVWPTFVVLLLQAIFFAHGGLSTLGINTLTLGVVGPLLGAAGARALARLPGALAVGLACAAADIAVYTVDAAVLSLALDTHTPVARGFPALLMAFLPVQLPLAALEGLASAAVYRALARRRPALLPRWLAGPALAAVLAVGLGGCGYAGIDGAVFGAAAAAAGQSPQPAWLDASAGELGLAMSILLPFAAGVVVGRSWAQLERTDDARAN